jgi:hypothetical protein
VLLPGFNRRPFNGSTVLNHSLTSRGVCSPGRNERDLTSLRFSCGLPPPRHPCAVVFVLSLCCPRKGRGKTCRRFATRGFSCGCRGWRCICKQPDFVAFASFGMAWRTADVTHRSTTHAHPGQPTLAMRSEKQARQDPGPSATAYPPAGGGQAATVNSRKALRAMRTGRERLIIERYKEGNVC